MKGQPLKRKAGLKRRSPLRAKRRKGPQGKPRRPPRRAGGVPQDPKYLAWVREHACCVGAVVSIAMSPNGIYSTFDYCKGDINAHHAGRKGTGQKCPDNEAIALCRKHHEEWHRCGGFFFGLTKEQRREWADARIAETQAAYGRSVEGAALLP